MDVKNFMASLGIEGVTPADGSPSDDDNARNAPQIPPISKRRRKKAKHESVFVDAPEDTATAEAPAEPTFITEVPPVV